MNSFLTMQQSRTGSNEGGAKKPELLCPAGGMECVYAAVENGCTAIYTGLTEFSARQNANNFTAAELERAIDYCHLRGVKLFVAANTLVKDCEINRFLDVVESTYLIGADGIIVQDIGCASLIKRYFPDFYLSASTQMTIHDLNGAQFLSKQGFDRVILSRELSVSEIAEICAETSAEIECFIHGALCVSYSGQCLFSAFNGGRSGNRGACAQPCRLQYGLTKDKKELTHGGLLSPKDAMGLYMLPSLIESGVSSFKIEGRMKSPEYVAVTASVYRKYIDLYFESPLSYEVDERDIMHLAAVFNRSGFNNGYFNDYSGREMLTDAKVGNSGVYIGKVSSVSNKSVSFQTLFDVSPGDGIEIQNTGAYITKSRKAGDTVEAEMKKKVKLGAPVYRTFDKKLLDELKASYSQNRRKLDIDGLFTAKHGEKISFCVNYNDTKATAFAGIPEKSENAAVTHETVKKQMLKTGSTPFALKSLDIELEDGLFVSVSELNAVRREALIELENKIILKNKRTKCTRKPYTNINVKCNKERKNVYTVLVRSAEQLEAAMNFDFGRLYIDFHADKRGIEHFREKGISVYKCLDRIQRDIELFSSIDEIGNSLYDGYLARTYGQIEKLSGRYEYAVDYTLNTFNMRSISFWIERNCKSVCYSPELGMSEIVYHECAEVIRYGKIVVMTTVQCPIGNFCGDKSNIPFCKDKGKGGSYSLTNGKEYHLMPVCDKCYCIVLSAQPIKITSQFPARYQRLEFSDESYVDTHNIMSSFIK